MVKPSSPASAALIAPNPTQHAIAEHRHQPHRRKKDAAEGNPGQTLRPSSDDASLTMSVQNLPTGSYIVRVNLDGVNMKDQMISVVK